MSRPKPVPYATLKNLLDNSRFYILALSILTSLILLAVLRLSIESTQLFYIRLEQVYGLLSLIFLYIALTISPLSKLSKHPIIPSLLFARRAIGVSAALFGLLHAAVAIWGQSGGLTGIGLLPDRFKLAFLIGLIALVILLIMAATSFNKVIDFMTFKRWKLLHRLVYFGGILIILHVWMIGTHVAYAWAKVAGFVALALFFGLEAARIAKKKDGKINWTVAILVWLGSLSLLALLPQAVENYHTDNHHGSSADHDAGSHR